MTFLGVIMMNNFPGKQPRYAQGQPVGRMRQLPSRGLQGQGTNAYNGTFSLASLNQQASGHKHTASIDLARQYERDIKQIERFLFRERDSQGRRLEKYLAHVRVIEDAHFPNRKPPEDSPIANKKYRYLILTVKISGRMRLHKARENPEGLIQIGRTWDFDELSLVEIDPDIPTGFTFAMGKRYYWETHSPKERRVWLTTILDHYIRYTNGGVPELNNCDVGYFHLEGLVSSLLKKNGQSSRINISTKTPRNDRPQKKSLSLEDDGMHISSVAAGLTNPHTSSQSQPLPRRRAPPYRSMTNGSSAVSTRSGAISISSKNSKTGVEHSPSKSKRSSIFSHSRHSSMASQEAKRLSRSMLAPFKRSSKNREVSEEEEAKRKFERQEYLKRQVLEEKQRQMEVERRRQEEITKKKLLKEKLDRENQVRTESINQQESEMQLDHGENNTQQHRRERTLGQEKPMDENIQPSAIQQNDNNSRNELERQKSAASSIEFVGHRKSHADIDKITGDKDREVEYDDFLGDYTDTNGMDESEDLHTAPLRLSLSNGLTKKNPHNDDYDDSAMTRSIDGALEDVKYQSLVDTSDLPADIKDIVSPDSHGTRALQVPDTASVLGEKDHLQIPSKSRLHSRSRAFSRVEAEKKDSNLADLFEEIGYDPSRDNYNSLKRKILKELERLQYHKVSALAETNDAGETLKSAVNQALNQCSQIDHGLSVLSVQLSSFKDSVDYIERQGHGLQVETTNKKLLKRELEEILFSADIPKDDLDYILKCSISLDEKPDRVENILSKLHTSLAKINGLSGNAGVSQISDMQALKEKHARLDRAASLFVRNFKSEVQKIFRSISLSLTSKLQSINCDNFISTFFSDFLVRKMSSLLAFSGCICFVKEISPNDFNDILVTYTKIFAEFFSKLGSRLYDDFYDKTSRASLSNFSFNNIPRKFTKGSIGVKNGTISTDKHLSGKKILLELGLTTNDTNEDVRTDTDFSKEKSSPADDIDTVLFLNKLLDIFLSFLSFQQEVSIAIFSLSSSISGFQSVISTDISERIKTFRSQEVFVNTMVETDREMSDGIYEMMKGICGKAINTLFKCLLDIAKTSMLQSPCIILLLQNKAAAVSSTDQEYVFSKFTQLESKVNTLWERQTEEQIQSIVSCKVCCQVMNFSKAYAIYFHNVELLCSLFQFGDLPIRATLIELSKYLWKMINDSLSKGIENIDNTELDSENNERSVDSVSLSTKHSLASNTHGSTSVETLCHLTLLLNYTWIINQIKDVNIIPLDLRTDIDELRSKELSTFTEVFTNTHKIGELMKLVDGMQDLVNSKTDPSTTNSYSRDNIQKIIMRFSGSSLKSTISELSTDLKMKLHGRCYDTEKLKTDKSTLVTGNQVEKEVYNSCLNSFSVLYGSVFSSFNHMVKQYYDGVSTSVDKIIINHNFNKLLMD